MNSKRRRLALAAIALMLLAAFGSTAARAQSGDTDDDILSRLRSRLTSDEEVEHTKLSVRGSSQIDVPADQAIVVFAAEARSDTASQAVSDSSDLADSLIAALGDAGVPDSRIETLGFSVFPYEERDPREPPRPEDALEDQDFQTIEVYRAINRIQVTLNDIDSVGEIIQIGVDAGATEVSDVRFGLQDPSAHRSRAIEAAAAAARSDAEALAETLGGEIVNIVEASVGDSAIVVEEAARAFDMAAASSVPIRPGDVTVSAHIELVLEMEGATLEAIPDAVARSDADDRREEDDTDLDEARDDDEDMDDEPTVEPPEETTEPAATAVPPTVEDDDATPTSEAVDDDEALGQPVDPTLAALATAIYESLHGTAPPPGASSDGDNDGNAAAAGTIAFAAAAEGEGARYRGRDPRVYIASDESDYRRLLVPLLPGDAALDVDWSDQIVVAVFLGERARAGGGLQIERIEQDEDRLVVTGAITEPDSEDSPVALSSPFQVVVIDRSELDGEPDTLRGRFEALTGR